MRKRKQMSKMSSRESVAPSTSAPRNRETRSSSWRRSSLVEDLVEVLVDGVGHLLLMGLRRRTPLGRPRDVAGPDDAVLHGQEPIEFVEWKSEQREEDLRRKGHGELLREIDLAPVDEAINQIVDQDSHLLLHHRHEAGGEDRVEQLAVLLVLGGIDLQGYQWPDVLQVDGGHVRREGLGMAKGLIDVDLAAQDHPGAFYGQHGAVFPERLEHRLGIGRHVGAHPERAFLPCCIRLGRPQIRAFPSSFPSLYRGHRRGGCIGEFVGLPSGCGRRSPRPPEAAECRSPTGPGHGRRARE